MRRAAGRIARSVLGRPGPGSAPEALLKLLAIAVAACAAIAARAESPQHFALEARLGWYHPQIDSEAGLQRARPPSAPNDAPFELPYARTFGSRGFFEFELEFDWQIVRFVGTLGVGATCGYFAAVGHGLYAVTGDPELAGTASTDATRLILMPVRALAVWRVDEAARRWNVPVVPYVKFGFGPTMYWVTNGRGQTSWAGQSRAAGSRWGWEAAFGAMLLLDFLDPHLANDFDRDWGVNNTYLFAEWRINRVGEMGRPGFVLSDDFFAGGFAFEF